MNNMLQVKKSNRPKVGLTALAVAFLTVLTVFFAGCKKDKESEPVDPFVTPGDTPNPNWVITGDNDMSASMTSIVKVSFTKSKGTLAAFIGNDCCGIATTSIGSLSHPLRGEAVTSNCVSILRNSSASSRLPPLSPSATILRLVI